MPSTNLSSIYRTLCSLTVESVFFPKSRETFTKTDHILSNKTSLNKPKRIQVTQGMFSEHMELNLKSVRESYL